MAPAVTCAPEQGARLNNTLHVCLHSKPAELHKEQGSRGQGAFVFSVVQHRWRNTCTWSETVSLSRAAAVCAAL
jgi:hypothetical protein